VAVMSQVLDVSVPLVTAAEVRHLSKSRSMCERLRELARVRGLVSFVATRGRVQRVFQQRDQRFDVETSPSAAAIRESPPPASVPAPWSAAPIPPTAVPTPQCERPVRDTPHTPSMNLAARPP
jgi:hypothetical protein